MAYLRLKYPICPTIFAMILRVATFVRSVFNNVVTAACSTGIRDGFLYHAVSVPKLSTTYLLTTTVHPTLTITYQNGISEDVVLAVPILVWHPLFIVGGLAWLVGLYIWLQQKRPTSSLNPERSRRVPASALLLILFSISLPIMVLEIGLRWHFTEN
ncbi:MAG: hypothetical protein ACPG7F_08945, partial [Aggregatilineales bacterium]